jgi:undecaprenyl-diphosphatase
VSFGRRQVATGLVLFGTSALAATVGGPSRWELAAFRPVNALPNAIHPPVWTVMQLGALGAGPLLGAVAWRVGRRDLAARMVADATATWALAKVIKRMVQRGRPAALVSGTHVRGKEATGFGYLSGHAGVATGLMTAAASAIPGQRRLFAAAAVSVGLARVYVGAHLPLDVIGGFGLGLAVDATVRQYLQCDAGARRAVGVSS